MMLKLKDMGEENDCNTRLSLAIGPQKVFAASGVVNMQRKQELELSLWHYPDLNEDGGDQDQDLDKWGCRLVDEEEHGSNKCFNKHERNVARKKFQLTREQTCSLEKIFEEHSTLSQIQKQELASRLSLLPRQVEVWFQNRRARTKIKQTEVDCMFIKRCCQNLINENRRLKKELQELRALNVRAPMSPRFALRFHQPTAERSMLAIFSSCEKFSVPSPTAMNESMSEDEKPKLVIGPLFDK